MSGTAHTRDESPQDGLGDVQTCKTIFCPIIYTNCT